jgi:hypothetical protein
MGRNYVFPILNHEKSPQKMSNSLNMAQNCVASYEFLGHLFKAGKHVQPNCQ